MVERKGTWKIGLIVSLLTVFSGLGLVIYSAVENHNTEWARSVEFCIGTAKNAEDSWEVRYALEEANKILAEHGRLSFAIVFYINLTFTIEEIEDEREYRYELSRLKKELDSIELYIPSSLDPFTWRMVCGGIMLVIGVLGFAVFAPRKEVG